MKKPIKGVDCFYYKNKKVKTIYIEEESLMIICDNKEILEELKKGYSVFLVIIKIFHIYLKKAKKDL